LQRTAEAYVNNGSYSGTPIDWEAGSYQKFIVTGAPEVQFQNFFNDNSELAPRVGKVTLELTLGGGEYATMRFLTTGGAVIKKSGFPAVNTGEYGTVDLVLTSTDNPVILEVWQHTSNMVFIKYVGAFA
jgi:hypothetical protein